MAIDKEKLLDFLKSLDSTYVTKEIIPQIESGAFDIKPSQLISPTIPQVGRGGEDMDKYMGGVAYPREGTHTVEVSLQWGEYKGVVICNIRGNVIGASVIDSALNSLADGDFEPNMNFAQNQRHIELIDSGTYEGFVKHYRLINELGHALHIDLDDIADCIIGVQIVGWEASD